MNTHVLTSPEFLALRQIRISLQILEGIRYAVEVDLPPLLRGYQLAVEHQQMPEAFLKMHEQSLLELPGLFEEVLLDMNRAVAEVLPDLR